MRILCVGEMLIDFTPAGGAERTYTANPGGAPANVAIAAARNGIRAGFLGKLGNDGFGRLLAETLRSDGVEHLAPELTDEATTTLAFVTLDSAGERSFTFARKPGADLLLNETDVEAVDFSAWDIIHAGSVSQSGRPERDAVLLALKKAKAAGKLVSFDINYRDAIWTQDDCKREVDKVLPYVDLLKLSEEELVFTGGEESLPACMEQNGIAAAVLTRGERGATVFYGGGRFDVAAFKAEAVDTTGAGDAFWGGFLSIMLAQGARRTEDLTMERLAAAARYGAAAGALCVQKPGGIPALPTRSEIEAVLGKRSTADRKYTIDTKENKRFLAENARRLLAFGRNYPSFGGSSFYLGDDGAPWTDRPRETWITARMVHVYSIGSMTGDGEYKALAAAGLRGLRGELRDRVNGGWYAGLTRDGEPLPDKQCYAHAFVILAASSALLAGLSDAAELLKDALDVFDRRFWDEAEGLAVDRWNTDFTALDDYRGLNANMHTVEAFLAASDATGDERYRARAGRIIDRVLRWAGENGWRIPEHYTKDWRPDPERNRERPDDPFKPYGATPGHAIEWARLIVEWRLGAAANGTAYNALWKESAASDALNSDPYITAARALYDRAVKDAWNADGAPGFVYTTGWDGAPACRDRMHWTLAEAIDTATVLYRVTGDSKYADDYAAFLRYLDNCVIDRATGSWFHQLDEQNRPKNTVWPGKPDLYHAFQAMLIPYRKEMRSVASCAANGNMLR